MEWDPQIDTWIVVVGVLCALASAPLGVLLVLRRVSMMGDAISHAVLPGLALAFMWTGSRSSLGMFVGAAVAGFATTAFTQWVRSFGKVESGAAMGVVFTTLFALGLVLIRAGAHKVDLDPSCVLYGAIELAPLDTVIWRGWEVPRAALVLGVVALINLLFLVVLFKEWKLTSFDPALATTLGFRAGVMHYLLMGLVAVTTVACFEAIGSILVIAMLIVPAAAALQWTDRLAPMLALAALIGAASAALGHVLAITAPAALFPHVTDTTTAGMMAVATGQLLVASVLLSPRHGVLARGARQASLSLRIAGEDLLSLLYRLEEAPADSTRQPTDARRIALALPHVGPWRLRAATAWMLWNQRIHRPKGLAGGFELTEAGRIAAKRIVRSHRLWETYLHEVMALPADHIHGTAERLEHATDERLLSRLAEGVGHPGADPHGKSIPPAP